jgi:hypothetical protein
LTLDDVAYCYDYSDFAEFGACGSNLPFQALWTRSDHLNDVSDLNVDDAVKALSAYILNNPEVCVAVTVEDAHLFGNLFSFVEFYITYEISFYRTIAITELA